MKSVISLSFMLALVGLSQTFAQPSYEVPLRPGSTIVAGEAKNEFYIFGPNDVRPIKATVQTAQLTPKVENKTPLIHMAAHTQKHPSLTSVHTQKHLFLAAAHPQKHSSLTSAHTQKHLFLASHTHKSAGSIPVIRVALYRALHPKTVRVTNTYTVLSHNKRKSIRFAKQHSVTKTIANHKPKRVLNAKTYWNKDHRRFEA